MLKDIVLSFKSDDGALLVVFKDKEGRVLHELQVSDPEVRLQIVPSLTKVFIDEKMTIMTIRFSLKKDLSMTNWND